MKRITVLLLILCLLLSGCSNWTKGSYSSVKPHKEPFDQQDRPAVDVSDYKELFSTLQSLVVSGGESGILSTRYETEEEARADMEKAISELCQNDPFAAYAVEKISYSFGTSGSRNAIRIQIAYLPNRVKPDKIRKVQTLDQVQQIVFGSMNACDANVVLYFDSPEDVDYAQMVEDYALTYPQKVMEIPEVTVSLYPEQAQQQVVELKFTYQTSRAELRTMQNKVAPVFSSAMQYATGEFSEEEKAARLYTFLMERYEYNIQTSITPAYSLLLYGVGDHRAFAMVYAAMCRQSGLDCRMVTGTREGTRWVWNAVNIGGEYFYIDLLQTGDGGFRLHTQQEMENYVWDYSAYPRSQENS